MCGGSGGNKRGKRTELLRGRRLSREAPMQWECRFLTHDTQGLWRAQLWRADEGVFKVPLFLFSKQTWQKPLGHPLGLCYWSFCAAPLIVSPCASSLCLMAQQHNRVAIEWGLGLLVGTLCHSNTVLAWSLTVTMNGNTISCKPPCDHVIVPDTWIVQCCSN